jgi:hypothetical protein
VNVFALPLLAAATMVYAGFVSSLGLWFSTVSGSTMRAGLFTLLAALLFLAVPGALTTAGSSAINLPTPDPFWSWRSMMDYGLSPPTTLWVLSFRTADLLGGEQLNTTTRILSAVTGLHGLPGSHCLVVDFNQCSIRKVGRFKHRCAEPLRRWLRPARCITTITPTPLRSKNRVFQK